jgi:pimeloyl-ACP methyl ester carboxylesterase
MNQPVLSGDLKEVVVTVHGINSDGGWQRQVRAVLEPHFRCAEIKYGYFRNLGFVALVFDPGVLLLLLVATYCLGPIGVLKKTMWFILPAVFLVFAYGLAVVRRNRALDLFAIELAAHISTSPCDVHLIAHSFGTFLAGRTIKKYPWARRLRRVVLTGGVLPVCFNWKRVLDRPGAPFTLRNEVGKRDLVSLAAGLTLPFALGLGASGVIGFWKGVGLWRGLLLWQLGTRVYPVTDPYDACSTAGAKQIQNVRLEEYTHSDHFISPLHAETFWLPFLWGMAPRELALFLSSCRSAANFHRLSDDRNRDLAVEELTDRSWRFLGSRTLEEDMQQRLGPGATADDVVYAIRLVCEIVDSAYKESRSNTPVEDVVLALRPTEAIRRAVDVVRNRNHASPP